MTKTTPFGCQLGFRPVVRIAPAQMTGSQMPPSNFQLAWVAPDRGGVSLIWGYLGMAVLDRPTLPIGLSRAEISALFVFFLIFWYLG